MAQDIIAKLSNFANSAQKTRLVIDLVRGKPALKALEILATTPPNKAAMPVRKLIYQRFRTRKRTLVLAETIW